MFPLSHMLKAFVRVGSLTIIDAERPDARLFGRSWPHCDGTVHRPFAHHQALLESYAACGRGLRRWRRGSGAGYAQGLPGALLAEPRCTGFLSAAENRACDHARAEALPAGQSDRQGREERRAPLRPRQRVLQTLPRRGHAVFLRLLPQRRRHPRAGAAEQAAPDRGEAAAEARTEDPRHRIAAGASSRSISPPWRTSM